MTKENAGSTNLADKKSADRLTNKTVLGGIILINIILSIAYYIEYINGLLDLDSYGIVLIAAIIPSILGLVAYLKNKSSILIRYIMVVGFSILYAYIMYISNTSLSFCYAIAVIVLIVIYAEWKLIVGFSIYSLIINIIVIVNKSTTQSLEGNDLADAKIVISCLVLVGVFVAMSTVVVSKIATARLDEIEKEKKENQELLNRILKVSDEIINGVEDISSEIITLHESVNTTSQSMEDVAAGASDTAEAIKTQQVSTENIHQHISDVGKMTKMINESVSQAHELLEEGSVAMEGLVSQVVISENESGTVAKEMKELKQLAKQMEGIMDLINNVASETDLLALNASIEAARAGAAGRGFSVVASEISKLANQTSTATGNISQLIEYFNISLIKVASSIDHLITSNHTQSDYVNKTESNFNQIQASTNYIYTQSKQLEDVVEKVSVENTSVVESIQNISAITQETSARAFETKQSSKVEAISVEKVKKIVVKLSENAEELKNK